MKKVTIQLGRRPSCKDRTFDSTSLVQGRVTPTPLDSPFVPQGSRHRCAQRHVLVSDDLAPRSSHQKDPTEWLLKKFFLFCALTLVQQVHGFSRVGSWTGSFGFGFTSSPTLLLLSPQLDYGIKNNLSVGPLVQVGLGDATLFTGSIAARYSFGTHPKLKPAVEGAFGIAAGSSHYSSSIGVHMMMGLGADYAVDSTLALGTMIRANFTPPLKTFILSWPVFIARLVF